MSQIFNADHEKDPRREDVTPFGELTMLLAGLCSFYEARDMISGCPVEELINAPHGGAPASEQLKKRVKCVAFAYAIDKGAVL